jgi:ComF family protein
MTQDDLMLNDGLNVPQKEGAARLLARVVLDLLLPHQCLSCNEMVGEQGSLCSECWGRITFPSAPYCDICALPFEIDVGEGSICGACARQAPDFDRARSAMVYNDASRRLVLGFKHGDRTEAAPAFGRWMLRSGAELVANSDIIVPVPLHWTRLFARKFNQAALLAHEVGGSSGVPVVPDLLIRRKRTPPQGKLSTSARRRNLQGAIAVKPNRSSFLRGKTILLVDDVLTTGATVSACARVLRRGGASNINVLTLARVVRAST